MKHAYIYARVSTEEQAQEGISIDTQINVCTRWGIENDFIIVRTYKDEGKSATSINRPALQQMLSDVITLKEVDAVLVQDSDRLARNTLDHLNIRNTLRKNSIKFVSVSQPMLDDSPEGQVMDTMIASFNAFQSQITGRKTSKTAEEKALLGWYPKNAPFGYRNIDNPSPTCKLDKRIIGVDDLNSKYVIELFNMYATGNYNLNQLADYLNDKGVKPIRGTKIHHTFIAQILKDEFYIGYFKWNGRRQGKHQKLIDEDIFARVQRVLQAHNQGASRKRIHTYLLRGFLFCGKCNNRMWAELKKKKSGLVYNFYFCKHCGKGTYFDTEDIEKQVTLLFKEIRLGEQFVQRCIKKAQGLLEESRVNEDSKRRSLIQQKGEIEKAMREAEDSRFLAKTLSDDAFTRIYSRYEAQLSNVNEEFDNLQIDHTERLRIIETIFRMAENIGNTYEKALPTQKRNYLGLFFKQIVTENGKVIGWELSDLLKPLIEEGSVRVGSNWLP